MSPATIVAILQAFIGLVGEVPELISAAETVISLVQSGAAPTAEQQATIDAGLTAANAALQAS